MRVLVLTKLPSRSMPEALSLLVDRAGFVAQIDRRVCSRDSPYTSSSWMQVFWRHFCNHLIKYHSPCKRNYYRQLPFIRRLGFILKVASLRPKLPCRKTILVSTDHYWSDAWLIQAKSPTFPFGAVKFGSELFVCGRREFAVIDWSFIRFIQSRISATIVLVAAKWGT